MKSGSNNPFYGKKHTEETKKKMSLARKGRKLSEETRIKMSISRRKWKHTDDTRAKFSKLKQADKNPMWKGDDVGYLALHNWVTNHLSKPELCQICNKVPPYDLANISGEYKRDLNDWQWLCRSCHMISDGRMEKLRISHIIDMSGRKCFMCGSSKTRRRKSRNNRELWYRLGNEFICSNCYTRGTRRSKIKN